MFQHGKTNKVYHSIQEKLKYFKDGSNDLSLSKEQRGYAKNRIKQLNKLHRRNFDDPELVVTDDKKFGNGMSKPRLCVAVKQDSKNRVLLAPLIKTTCNYVVLDNDIDRLISKTADGRNKWVNKDDIYEDKYISPHAELTSRDKQKIKRLYK